jgi:hypothetical protein
MISNEEELASISSRGEVLDENNDLLLVWWRTMTCDVQQHVDFRGCRCGRAIGVVVAYSCRFDSLKEMIPLPLSFLGSEWDDEMLMRRLAEVNESSSALASIISAAGSIDRDRGGVGHNSKKRPFHTFFFLSRQSRHNAIF